MTARDYKDEVMLRVPSLDVAKQVNSPFLMTCINEARQEVQRNLLKIYPELFGKIANIDIALTEDTDFEVPDGYSSRDLSVISVQLPGDFIKEHCLFLKYIVDGATYRMQMRATTKRELYNALKDAWISPSRRSPLYCIDRYNDTHNLYIAGLVDDVRSLFDDATSIQAEVWYSAIINQLEDPNAAGTTDSEITFPVFSDEFINLTAIYNVLKETNSTVALDYIRENLRLMDSMVRDLYETEFLKRTILLPSKEGM